NRRLRPANRSGWRPWQDPASPGIDGQGAPRDLLPSRGHHERFGSLGQGLAGWERGLSSVLAKVRNGKDGTVPAGRQGGPEPGKGEGGLGRHVTRWPGDF